MTRTEPATATESPPDDDPRVVRALEFYLSELEAGRVPNRSALLAEYAEVAGPLADCLDGLEFLRTAARPADEPTPIHQPERLGDFRLIRAIGRGGMGVVYEAEQLSLGRRVAVKTLPLAAGLQPTDLRRFRHEARTAALLSHPHIVPIYAVGEDRGVHYFAMRLIEGRSLAELIERRRPENGSTLPQAAPGNPTATHGEAVEVEPVPDGEGTPFPDDPRFAAELALQAAEALAHAHAAGIVHRDVKPANLLLDDRGHLWVADFGLAFLPGATRLTQSGALVGTLRYMSPEQVEPRRGVVDGRADLYGLGATLYELVTRRPVIEAGDHGAAIAAVLNRTPIPPRRLNAKVPADLETIVLKMLAKNPSDRYASADDLADDLRRFLAGKPILARRPTLYERLIRWAGEHRAATLAAGAAVAVVIGLQAVHQRELALERNETLIERQQARAAVDDLYGHFSEQWLAIEPGAEPRQREFLAKAQAYYDRLAAMPGSSWDDRFAAAVARRRAANIAVRLGREDDADAKYRDAEDRFRELATEARERVEAMREIAICAADYGNLLRMRGRSDDAAGQFRSAEAYFRQLIERNEPDPRDRAGLAGVENNLGLLWQNRGKANDAEACFRSARSRFAALAGDFPNRAIFVSEAANCGHNLGEVQSDTGRLEDAVSTFRETLILRQRARELAPGVPAYRRELARTQTSLAAAMLKSGKIADAAGIAEQAVAERERLAAESPAVPAYRFEWACGLRILAECRSADGRRADANRTAEHAVELLKPLAEGSGQSAVEAELARAYQTSGAILAADAKLGKAEVLLREASRTAGRLPADVPAYQRLARSCRYALAGLLRSTGRADEADALARIAEPIPTGDAR